MRERERMGFGGRTTAMRVCDDEGLPGRDGELRALHELLGAACAGNGAVVVLEGQAGIGKTALVRWARKIAAGRGMRVLHARGSELEDGLAFGVTRELYGSVDPTLTSTGAAALAEPVLRVASGSHPARDLFAVLHGLYWLTADLASTAPMLVAVDDAHWCDGPTLRHLAYLAHRLDGLPVAVLLALRPTTDQERRPMLDAIASEPWTVVRTPTPLPPSAMHKVVSAMLGEAAEPAFTAACHGATGGNPFLLVELLSEAARAGLTPTARDASELRALAPPGVQRAIQTRLARLPEGAVALARAVAVLGDGTSLRRAARLAGLTDAEVGPLGDELVQVRILQPRLTPSFAHPLVRSAVTAGLGPAETAAWHRRAADLIAAEGGSGDELVPHLLAASTTGDPWVVERLCEAAHRDIARGAPDTAVRYLQRALEEPPTPQARAGVLHALGVAQARAGVPDSHRALEAALALTDDPVDRARIALDLLRSHFPTRSFVLAAAICEGVLDKLGDTAPKLRMQIEADLITAGLQDLRTRASTRELSSRRPAPEPAGPAECRMLASLAMEEMLAAGNRDRAILLAEKSLVGGHLVTTDAAAVLPSAVATLTLSGRVRRSLQVWDDLMPLLRRRGDAWAAAGASAFRGLAAYHAGDLYQAIGDTRLAIELSYAARDLTMAPYATAWLVYALIEAGDYAEADEELDRQPVGSGPDAPFAANYLLSARGTLRLAQGRLDDAVTDLRECGRRLEAWAIPGPGVCPWRPALALALHQRGDLEEASSVSAAAVASARSWDTPHVMAEALRAAGLVGGGDHGRALLEKAVAVAADGESPLEHARTLTDLGGALRRAGETRAAREPLRTAVDLASACGADAVARKARDELVASGARPRRARTTGMDALTPKQRRTAEMAAKGMTSREIAQALFVSERTVETHLTQAYRKLGIAARAQLADALRSPARPRLDTNTPEGSRVQPADPRAR